MAKKKKQKKEKVIYYDDNSTISDMSNVTRIGQRHPPQRSQQQPQPKKKSTAKEKWRTYFSAVKMMFFPMCIVLIILGILYLLLRILTGGF